MVLSRASPRTGPCKPLAPHLGELRRRGVASSERAPLIFEHDAFIVEVPEASAEAAHEEVGRCMIKGMEVCLKDRKRPELSVAVRTDGALIRRDASGHSRWVK